jgi:hypothetical protein
MVGGLWGCRNPFCDEAAGFFRFWGPKNRKASKQRSEDSDSRGGSSFHIRVCHRWHTNTKSLVKLLASDKKTTQKPIVFLDGTCRLVIFRNCSSQASSL